MILGAVASGFYSLRRSVGLGVVLFLFSSALLAGDDSEINVSSLKKLVKDKDKAVAYTATAELAAYYRREGDLKKAEKLLSNFSSPSGFDRLPAKVAIPYLRCLLENAHIKALKKDLPGSLQLLNWAERRKRDYERAFSCMKYAEILLDLNETERANAYLKNVRQILAKHINESAVSGGAIGQGSKALDTESSWRTLRDQADHLALEIEEVQLSKKFGATYASYVKLRRLQRIVKRSKAPRYFNEAIKLCDEIEESDPESQFAAAAGYLKAQILLKNPTQNPKKAIKEAKDQLEKFIKSNPEGLYRGEAMMLLGKISLEKEWNAKDAEKYYSQALTWFKQAREKRDALSLYAPMSNDLKTQTKATQRPTTLNQWKRTVYHEEDPLRLYNTASAPTWYVSDKEKNCVFVLGLVAFSNQKYDIAKEYWSKIKILDKDIASMDPRLPNIFTRLIASCDIGYIVFTSKEKENIQASLRLKILYAEYLFVLEHFNNAISIYDDIYVSTDDIDTKALAMLGKAYVVDTQGENNFKTTAQKCFDWILNQKKLKNTAIYANAYIGKISCLMGIGGGHKNARPMLEKYFKNSKLIHVGREDYFDRAVWNLCMCMLIDKEYDKAEKTFHHYMSKRSKATVYYRNLEEKFQKIKKYGKPF